MAWHAVLYFDGSHHILRSCPSYLSSASLPSVIQAFGRRGFVVGWGAGGVAKSERNLWLVLPATILMTPAGVVSLLIGAIEVPTPSSSSGERIYLLWSGRQHAFSPSSRHHFGIEGSTSRGVVVDGHPVAVWFELPSRSCESTCFRLNCNSFWSFALGLCGLAHQRASALKSGRGGDRPPNCSNMAMVVWRWCRSLHTRISLVAMDATTHIHCAFFFEVLILSNVYSSWVDHEF